MIRNKVTLTIPGWQNSAMRNCWENQFFMPGAGWEKVSSKRILAGNSLIDI